jgi:choline kinase
MNLIIPAAGRARRLKPLTNSCPKNLLQIGDKSILEMQIESIPLNKIDKIVFVLGFMKDKIIEHVNSLNIDIPVSYYYNDNYLYSNCAYSLLMAKEEMVNGFILLNCDLIFSKFNFERVLDSKKRNTIAARKIKEFRTDLQKVYINNGKITKWADGLKNANAEVMGPLKMCSEDAGKIIEYYDSLPKIEKEKMHCFSLFSNSIEMIDYYPIFVNDNEWKEIDTSEDLHKTISFLSQ